MMEATEIIARFLFRHESTEAYELDWEKAETATKVEYLKLAAKLEGELQAACYRLLSDKELARIEYEAASDAVDYEVRNND